METKDITVFKKKKVSTCSRGCKGKCLWGPDRHHKGKPGQVETVKNWIRDGHPKGLPLLHSDILLPYV